MAHMDYWADYWEALEEARGEAWRADRAETARRARREAVTAAGASERALPDPVPRHIYIVWADDEQRLHRLGGR